MFTCVIAKQTGCTNPLRKWNPSSFFFYLGQTEHSSVGRMENCTISCPDVNNWHEGGGCSQQQYAAHHRTHTTTELGFRVLWWRLQSHQSHVHTQQPVYRIQLFLRWIEVQSRSQMAKLLQNIWISSRRQTSVFILAHLRCHVDQLVCLQLSTHFSFQKVQQAACDTAKQDSEQKAKAIFCLLSVGWPREISGHESTACSWGRKSGHFFLNGRKWQTR